METVTIDLKKCHYKDLAHDRMDVNVERLSLHLGRSAIYTSMMSR